MLAEAYQRQLHQQLLVGGLAEVEVTLLQQLQRPVIPLRVEVAGRGSVSPGGLLSHSQQGKRLGSLGHQQVANVLGQAVDEEAGVEAGVAHLAVEQQRVLHTGAGEGVGEAEVGLVVEHVEVGYGGLVGDVAGAGGRDLVEDREGVAHGAIGLAGYYLQCGVFGRYPLGLGHAPQLGGDVALGDAGEVVGLAAAKDGRQHLVLLRGGEDEDGVARRLLQGLEESVEGARGEHVHLVDDEDAVAAGGGRHLHLLGQGAHLAHTVVGGGVELDDVVADATLEVAAGVALAAGLSVGGAVLAVDGLGEDARAARLAHAARPAEEVRLGQPPGGDGVAQGARQGSLTNHGRERGGTVFPCRYYVRRTHAAKVRKKAES